MATLLPAVAALGCPPVPVTAPSTMCNVRDATPASRFLSVSDNARWTVLAFMAELPAIYWAPPPAVMPIFEAFTLWMSLSNCIDRVALPVWYAAFLKTGLGTITLLWLRATVMPAILPGTPAARMPGGASTYIAGEAASQSLSFIVAAASLPVQESNGSGQSGFATGTVTECMPAVRVTFLPPAGANNAPS